MRAQRAKKRITKPDPLYRSRLVAKTINALMKDGKKSIAENIMYSSLEKLSEDRKEALMMFEDAVKNLMPRQEVRSRRVGGATYQVPMPVKHQRSEALAIRWLVDAARKRQGKPMGDFFSEEIKNAKEGTGSAIAKRDETHRMAESNRAFAHFRF